MSDEFVKKHPNPFIKLFANLPKGNNNFVTPAIGIWPEYLAELNSAFESIILMKATPREALNRVQERIQPKLDSYLKVLKLRNEIADTPTN